MHPSVVRDDPEEKCPICGMPLSKRKKGEVTKLPPGVLARVQLSPLRVRQAGVATSEVGYRTLVREVRTVGFIDFDERRLVQLSSRIRGRADELHVDFEGTDVRAGDPLYSLYSPDLVTTQQAYLGAIEELARLERQSASDAGARAAAEKNVRSARERLVLWGITEEDLTELERTTEAKNHLVIRSPISGIVIEKRIFAGRYVEVGEIPYTVADLSQVWALAEVFEADIGLVHVGQSVEITTEAHPGVVYRGDVSFVYPVLDVRTRTVKVRVEVANPELALKPGMFVSAVMRFALGEQGEIFWGC